MQAQVIRGHGEIDDIAFEANWPDPVPGPGEVVLRVGACSLNYHDLFTLRGMPGIRLDMPLIMGISDRVYCLEAGAVIAEGPPAAVRNDPRVVASYLGTNQAAIQRSGAVQGAT